MKRLILLVFTLIISGLNAQYRDYNYYKSLNFNIGYHYHFSDEKGGKDFHSVELGLSKLNFGGVHGGGGTQYGGGLELALNTHKFVIAPKISGVAYYQGIVLGVELASYTDFNDANLVFVPMLGFGINGVKLTINPHLFLLNKNFMPMNKGSVSFVWRIPLKQEKRKE